MRIADELKLVDDRGMKLRRAGQPKGRRDIVIKDGLSWSGFLQRFVERFQMVDEINRRYRKLVIDPSTGEILRDVDEPLEHHTGRGSAAPQRRSEKNDTK